MILCASLKHLPACSHILVLLCYANSTLLCIAPKVKHIQSFNHVHHPHQYYHHSDHADDHHGLLITILVILELYSKVVHHGPIPHIYYYNYCVLFHVYNQSEHFSTIPASSSYS